MFGSAPRGRVVVVGELDMLTAPRLEQLLAALLRAGYRQLDVDVSGVDFIAAAGLNALVRAGDSYQNAGGRLHLIALPPLVQRLLTMFGIDADLHLVSSGDGTLEAAATRHNGSGPAQPGGARGASASGWSPTVGSARPEYGRS